MRQLTVLGNIRNINKEIVIEPDDLRDILVAFMLHLNTPDLMYCFGTIDTELDYRKSNAA